MRTRIVSAVIGVGLFLGLCFGGLLPFTVGVVLLAALGTAEFVAAYRRALAPQSSAAETADPPAGESKLNQALPWLGVALPVLAYAQVVRSPLVPLPFVLLPVLLVGGFAALVFRAARTGRTLGGLRAHYGWIGLVYIGLLFSSYVCLRGVPGSVVVPPFGTTDRGAWFMLFVAVCVWATDTCAYLIGRRFGRRKLAPTLSPGKTVAGAFGGLAGAMVAGVAFGTWIHLPLAHGLAVGAIAGVAGQIGDLFESALKREIGIKDFGQVMPGHGGTLDRFDSLLFVAPLAYLYLRLLSF